MSRNRKILIILRNIFNLVLTLGCCCLLLGGCYRHSTDYRSADGGYYSEEDRYGATTGSEASSGFPSPDSYQIDLDGTSRLPWEAWPFRQTLRGTPLGNVYILKGDELLKEGLRRAALGEYQLVDQSRLSTEEREAVVVRIASTQLTLDRAEQALTTLSTYCKSQNFKVEDVSRYFSLVFAYSYGRVKDIEQSLAWFSKVYRLSGGKGPMAGSASSGVRALVRSIPKDDFYKLLAVWSDDIFISGLLGQEARRRTLTQQGDPADPGYDQLWAVGSFEQPFSGEALNREVSVSMLLPLSGKYASLGKSVKNGIELAFSTHRDLIKLTSKDTAGDAYQAAALVQRIEPGQEPTVLLGPLLASPVRSVSDIARRRKIPIIALSKTSELVTGDTIFRLGPTVQSQVESLLNAVLNSQNIRLYALLFPENESGYEYAQVFKRELDILGLKLSYEQNYPASGDADYFPIIGESLEESDAEAVFIADDLKAVTRFSISISDKLRSRLLILGPARWYNPVELKRSRSVLEGIIFVVPFFEESKRDYIKQFIRTYQHRYSSKPGFLSAQGFDAATITVAALQRQQEKEISFSEALSQIDTYRGLTGEINVSPNGELSRKFIVVQMKPRGLEELQVPEVPTYRMRGNSEF